MVFVLYNLKIKNNFSITQFRNFFNFKIIQFESFLRKK